MKRCGKWYLVLDEDVRKELAVENLETRVSIFAGQIGVIREVIALISAGNEYDSIVAIRGDLYKGFPRRQL